jgi:hypothetical protein
MRVLIILTLLLASCPSPPGKQVDQTHMSTTKKQLSREIPNAPWEPIFFNSINERAALAELNDLRSTILDHDDIEVRVWYGFGVSALSGYAIKRRGGEWSALRIPPVKLSDPKSAKAFAITSKSGGQQLWERLTKEGLLTLPDSSTLPDNSSSLDGVSYVVEINMNLTYRTYMYGNPEKQKSPEARQMAEIIHTIYEELGP